jgi:two-component system chemotaxis sensor kinase CheA
VEGKQIFQASGGPVPVVYLRQCLNFDDNAQANETVSLAVVNISGHGTALVVDRFLSGRQAIVQPIGDAAVFGEKVVGVILAEDGSVIPVLNLAGLLDPVGIQANWCRTVAPDDVPVTKVPGILVVDDSMTTRTLEKNILESQGFRVSVSVDGSQALARLNGQDDFDLVITDVEMPLMNGFELIQEMKKNPRLARIPIIIVSSLEKREDKERGLSLGADAYIVKRSFEQQELLEVIRQII